MYLKPFLAFMFQIFVNFITKSHSLINPIYNLLIFLPMKTIVISFIFGCLYCSIITAQRPIVIEEKDITFSHGVHPGFVVSIPEVILKTVEEAWVKELEKGTKSKVQREINELSIFGAINKDIAEAPINVYSFIQGVDSTVVIFVTYELKKDEFITKEGTNPAFVSARDYLMNFAKERYLDIAKNQLQEEEKKLGKLENDLGNMQNDKIKYEKLIQSNNTAIGSINDELVILQTDLTAQNNELLEQTNQINAMEDGTIKEEKKKYINEIEKSIKKLNREIESKGNKIVELKSEIETAQNNIPYNLKEQERIGILINQQKEVVQATENKHNVINGYR
jgi:hypothetical protein